MFTNTKYAELKEALRARANKKKSSSESDASRLIRLETAARLAERTTAHLCRTLESRLPANLVSDACFRVAKDHTRRGWSLQYFGAEVAFWPSWNEAYEQIPLAAIDTLKGLSQ